MVNIKKLKAAMVLNGDNITTLAQGIGVSRSTLSAKMNGHRVFHSGEIVGIIRRYRLTEEQTNAIFFPDYKPNYKVIPVLTMGEKINACTSV